MTALILFAIAAAWEMDAKPYKPETDSILPYILTHYLCTNALLKLITILKRHFLLGLNPDVMAFLTATGALLLVANTAVSFGKDSLNISNSN